MTIGVLKWYWDGCPGTSGAAWLMPPRQTPAPGMDGRGYPWCFFRNVLEMCEVGVLGDICSSSRGLSAPEGSQFHVSVWLFTS